jgi:hypothetical protein
LITNPDTSKTGIPRLVGVLLLLLIVAIWSVIVPVIPSPNDLPYDQTYYSPLPGVVVAYYFDINFLLHGWRERYQDSRYNITYSDNIGDFIIEPDTCGSQNVMILQIKPIRLFGSIIHVQAFERTVCGHMWWP